MAALTLAALTGYGNMGSYNIMLHTEYWLAIWECAIPRMQPSMKPSSLVQRHQEPLSLHISECNWWKTHQSCQICLHLALELSAAEKKSGVGSPIQFEHHLVGAKCQIWRQAFPRPSLGPLSTLLGEVHSYFRIYEEMASTLLKLIFFEPMFSSFCENSNEMKEFSGIRILQAKEQWRARGSTLLSVFHAQPKPYRENSYVCCVNYTAPWKSTIRDVDGRQTRQKREIDTL